MTLLPWNYYIHQKVLIFYSLFLPAKCAAFFTKLKIYLIIYMFWFFQYVLSKWHTFSVKKLLLLNKTKTEWNEQLLQKWCTICKRLWLLNHNKSAKTRNTHQYGITKYKIWTKKTDFKTIINLKQQH